MIESHLPLVRAVARRYAGRGAELDDLVQVGAIGLIKATDRFDPRRGVAFATFATPTIEGEIRHHLRDRTSTLRIPRDVQRLGTELRRRQAELESTLGRAPTIAELAAAVGADERQVERVLAAEPRRDTVPISASPDSAEQAVAAEPFEGSDDRLLLADQMRVLDDRERRIVYLRFHADKTERDIAREVGISQAHVSRLLAGALTKLRAELGTGSGEATEADTTLKPVISTASGRLPERSDPPAGRRGRVKRSKDGSFRRVQMDHEHSGNRIEAVSGPRANSTLAAYLDLPYHVMVRAERDGGRSSWSAIVEELPGCSARGDTPDAAVEQLRPAMEAWLTAAIADEREIPRPSPETSKPKVTPSHSGRFLVRMSSELHEQLAHAAEREHVSLNRFVTDVLAASVDSGSATQPGAGDESAAGGPTAASAPRTPPARTLRVALAANLVVVVVAGLVAVALLVIALQRGI